MTMPMKVKVRYTLKIHHIFPDYNLFYKITSIHIKCSLFFWFWILRNILLVYKEFTIEEYEIYVHLLWWWMELLYYNYCLWL